MKALSHSSAQEKMKTFEKLCREQGLPLTVQRRVILESLAERQDHPTADQVFEAVAHRLPGLSRTTVYRVLETLVGLGVIHKANHLGSAARYDPNTERHHHLTCLSCHKVIDMEEETVRELALPKGALKGFEITDYSVHFKGYCGDCSKKREKSPPPGRKMARSR
jgi:Fur family transcriptional regulator, peroxide stress response regulator